MLTARLLVCNDRVNHDDAQFDPTRPLEHDVHCAECGYNLRGLSGDPVRCPECGDGMPASEVVERLQRIEDRRREAILRRVEFGPALCAFSLAAALVFHAIYRLDPSFFRPVLHVPIATFVGIWLIGFTLYSGRYHGLRHWGTAFLRYEFFGGVAAGMTYAALSALLGLSGLIQLGPCCGAMLLAPVAGVILLVPIAWIVEKARDQLAPIVDQLIQRDDMKP